MTAQEELEQALAELAEANARLEAAKAELASAEAECKAVGAKRPRRKRPVHQSVLVSECYGYGGPAPVGTRTRPNMIPVVTKELDPTDRPVRDRMPRKVSVRVYNDAGQQQGLAMTMTERESDKLEADLPLGWTITSRTCK